MSDDDEHWDEAMANDDPLQDAMDNCGMTDEGYCMLAGTEHCDFECPFRD
jgi:hypothetical protein